MCGIIGAFNVTNHKEIVTNGVKKINYRGKDNLTIVSKKNYSIAHLLHSIVSFVTQPIEYKNALLISNCEIYNYKELAKKYNILVKNDSELIIKLIDKIGLKKAMKSFDGVYSICYIKDNKVYLARDLLGIKPLWYSTTPFIFASEKKAIEKYSDNIVELNPRQYIEYDLNNKKIKFINKEFFKLKEEYSLSEKNIINKTKEYLLESVRKRIPSNKIKIGVLFSGGIDSTFVAFALQKLGINFTCYSSGTENSQDIIWAKKIAKKHNFKLKINYFDEEKVKSNIKEISNTIESNNVVKIEVSIPFWFACKLAKKDKCKVIFSGLGSEEIFAGYQRFEKSENLNIEGLHGLKQLYERDLYRDDVITMKHNLELRLPFLDLNLIKHALKIPNKLKIYNGYKKYILRVVCKKLGIDSNVCFRKKKAAQYGSNSSKIIKKLSKNFKSKSNYLHSIRKNNNLKLGVLFSSGKDSNLALDIMTRQNYKISCLITMLSNNPDSYMFQKPLKKIIELQSKSLNIPVVFEETKGVKEKELLDLKNLIKTAKRKYNLDGIVTGALFSEYQRSRIKKICEELGLKTFNPLWHLSQEQELYELLRKGFKFIIVKIAAMGLDKSWLGKIITEKDVDKLKKINKKYKINIAGEGGEYESTVINAPLFSKKIKIIKSEIIKEDENTAELIIKNAKLINK